MRSKTKMKYLQAMAEGGVVSALKNRAKVIDAAVDQATAVPVPTPVAPIAPPVLPGAPVAPPTPSMTSIVPGLADQMAAKQAARVKAEAQAAAAAAATPAPKKFLGMFADGGAVGLRKLANGGFPFGAPPLDSAGDVWSSMYKGVKSPVSYSNPNVITPSYGGPQQQRAQPAGIDVAALASRTPGTSPMFDSSSLPAQQTPATPGVRNPLDNSAAGYKFDRSSMLFDPKGPMPTVGQSMGVGDAAWNRGVTNTKLSPSGYPMFADGGQLGLRDLLATEDTPQFAAPVRTPDPRMLMPQRFANGGQLLGGVETENESTRIHDKIYNGPGGKWDGMPMFANGGGVRLYEDQVSRNPVARRTEAAKHMKVATSYDERGEPLGWRPAEGPEDTEGLDMRQLPKKADGGGIGRGHKVGRRHGMKALLANGGVANGVIHGRGGPTEDKQPILASPGEFVLPADTVEQIGVPSLRRLIAQTHTPVKNSAGRGFDEGGAVPDPWWKRGLRGARNMFGTAKDRVMAGVEAATAPAPVAAPQSTRTPGWTSGTAPNPAAWTTAEGMVGPAGGVRPMPPMPPPGSGVASSVIGGRDYGGRGLAPEIPAGELAKWGEGARGVAGKALGLPLAAGIEGYGAYTSAQRPGAIPGEEYARGAAQLGGGLAGAKAASMAVNPVANAVMGLPYPGAKLGAGALRLGAAGLGYVGGSLGMSALSGDTAGDRAALDPNQQAGSVVQIGPDGVPIMPTNGILAKAANAQGLPLSSPGDPAQFGMNNRSGDWNQPIVPAKQTSFTNKDAGAFPDTSGQLSTDQVNAAARAEMQAMDARKASGNALEGQRLNAMGLRGTLAGAQHAFDTASSGSNLAHVQRDMAMGKKGAELPITLAAARLAAAQHGVDTAQTQNEVRGLKGLGDSNEMAKAQLLAASAKYRDDTGLRGQIYASDNTARTAKAQAQLDMMNKDLTREEKNRNDRDSWEDDHFSKTVTDKETGKSSVVKDPEAKQEWRNSVVSYAANNPAWAKANAGKSFDQMTKTDLEPVMRAYKEQRGLTEAAKAATDSGNMQPTGLLTSAKTAPVKWFDFINTDKNKEGNISFRQNVVAKLNPFNSAEPSSRTVTLQFNQDGKMKEQQYMINDIIKDPRKAKALIDKLPPDQAAELTRMIGPPS